MELNREQIIKALEWCINNDLCDECPVGVSKCHITEDALSLIKELTAKTEAQDIVITELRKLLEKANHDADRYARKIKELTEENERLRAPRFISYPDGTTEMIPSVESVRADTVRKMRELIKVRCIKGGIYPAFVASTIDQIAKEMIGEGND